MQTPWDADNKLLWLGSVSALWRSLNRFSGCSAAALSLYTSVIHKNPITWAADHHPSAFVLTWLSQQITPENTFAFGGVGETAQGNTTCKLIKLLGLVQ